MFFIKLGNRYIQTKMVILNYFAPPPVFKRLKYKWIMLLLSINSSIMNTVRILYNLPHWLLLLILFSLTLVQPSVEWVIVISYSNWSLFDLVVQLVSVLFICMVFLSNRRESWLMVLAESGYQSFLANHREVYWVLFCSSYNEHTSEMCELVDNRRLYDYANDSTSPHYWQLFASLPTDLHLLHRVSQRIGILRLVKRVCLDTSVLLRCYYVFVLQFLEYCSPVCRSIAECHLQLLEQEVIRWPGFAQISVPFRCVMDVILPDCLCCTSLIRLESLFVQSASICICHSSTYSSFGSSSSIGVRSIKV